jgi:predicted PurR-regulated permease PerM
MTTTARADRDPRRATEEAGPGAGADAPPPAPPASPWSGFSSSPSSTRSRSPRSHPARRLAILLSFILWPIVASSAVSTFRKRWGIVVLLGLASVLGYRVYALSGPAASWIAAAPQALPRIEARLRVVKETVADVQEATNRVEQMATVGGNEKKQVVAVQQGPSLSSLLLASTWELLAGFGVILVLAYFLLASGDLFLRKFMHALPTRRDRQMLLKMARELQDHISGYLFTVTLINAGVGVGVAIAMAIYGLPNALLWGALAASFNFVPTSAPASALPASPRPR